MFKTISGYKIVSGPNVTGVIVVVGTIYLCYVRHTIWPAIILVSVGVIMAALALAVSGVIKGNDAQGR